MPSPLMAWMTQRVKWESQGENLDPLKEVDNIQPWVHADENSITVGVTVDSGHTSAICREYQPNGGLSSVTYRQGKVRI